MNRRGFLASAASVIVSPLAAAVVTTKTVVTNAAWTDLGPGPMLLSFAGDGVYAIGDTTPSLTEGFTIRKGASHALSTTSHVWVRATSSSGVSVYATGIASGGGGSTSVWSAADAAANGMTLSNSGLTVTETWTAGYQSIRSSISKMSGLLYVEFSTSVAPGQTSVLAGLASTGFDPTNYLGGTNYSVGIFPYYTLIDVSSGFSLNYQPSASTSQANDVVALAVNFTTGNIWIAINNVWMNGSDPATGSLPIVSFVQATVGPLFAGLTFSGANPGVWTLQATAASQKYVPPSGFTAWDSAAPTHSPQALAYLARTVGGDEGGNAANIASLIDGLVSDGVWAKLDCLYVLAQQNQTDALLNLVGTSYTAAIFNPVTFTSYIGFGFSGGGALDTSFNAATAPSPNYTANNASYGVWSYQVVTENYAVMGNGSSGAASIMYPHFTDGNFYARINDSSAGTTGPTPGTKGLFVGDRSSSTVILPYWNGIAQTLVGSTSQGPTNATFTIGQSQGFLGQDKPAPKAGTNQTLSAAFIGGSLGAAGQLALYNRLRTYMTAIGVL